MDDASLGTVNHRIRPAVFVALGSIVLAVGLSACGSVVAPSNGVIAWLALRSSPTTTTTTTTTMLPAAPPCKASRLQASPDRSGGGMGNVETSVVLTNLGPTCRLGGYPDLIGVSTSRGPVPLTARYGVAAYELMTNHKPFPGDTPAEILASQLEPAAPIPPREHNPAIPDALEKIILKCLAREPDRRHPFVSVLVRELQNALYV